jgi:AraC-like DNA-binding protein
MNLTLPAGGASPPSSLRHGMPSELHPPKSGGATGDPKSPPHSYLTRWRMGIAAQLREETDSRLSDIASRVGYRSEFSLAALSS